MSEREQISSALSASGYRVSKAARALGASRRTLQYRMREYGMSRGHAGRPKRLLHADLQRWVSFGVGIALGVLVVGAPIILSVWWLRKKPPVVTGYRLTGLDVLGAG